MTELATLVGQRLIVGFHGLTAPQYVLDWLRKGRCSGVILFGRNVESPAQLADLTRSLHLAAPEPILVSIDQEGGIVARLRQRHGFTESPGAMAIAASNDNVRHSETISRLLADEMRTLGINWTYAPVLDLDYDASNPTVGMRSYGRDPELVGQLAAAAVRGFQSGGVAACAKHFPGLGNTSVDSHLDLPCLDTSLETLIARDMEPYRIALPANPASIMVTHTLYSAVDATNPATLSPTLIKRLVRDELGYGGIVTTDCMEMDAIDKHYKVTESVVLAALAGVDLIHFSHTPAKQEEAYNALLEAARSGRIPRDTLQTSYERIQALKARYAINIDEIDTNVVGTQQHQDTARKIARSAIQQRQSNNGKVAPTAVKIGLIEFLTGIDTEAEECADITDFCAMFQQHWPQIQTLEVHPTNPTDREIAQAKRLAAKVDVLIVATRNAYRNPKQKALAEQLLESARCSILLVLRLPMDADTLQADAIYCTHGDSIPSLEAVVSMLSEFV